MDEKKALNDNLTHLESKNFHLQNLNNHLNYIIKDKNNTISNLNKEINTLRNSQTVKDNNINSLKGSNNVKTVGTDKQLDKTDSKVQTVETVEPKFSKSKVKDALIRVNKYITKNKKAPKTVKVDGKTLKLKEYINLNLLKNAKNNILKFKKLNKRLPNYVKIAGYKLYKNNYRILFNI